MINDVKIIPLQRLTDDRGYILHMLKSTDPHFTRFGEIYFSAIYPRVIKAWHLHKVMDLNYAVIQGMIKLVLYDQRAESSTFQKVQEIFLGDHNYALVHVPHGVVNGFQGLGTTTALVANCATVPHTPEEIIRIDPASNTIPYVWQ